ncbi:MAG: HD domain-containing protein [Firmicutes bacterium]|nr:HD domain-containing protein [Bacillota bacterium]
MQLPSRLQQQLEFIVEIDKLKKVFRQTFLIDKTRRENDAEHSWHLAMMAMVLGEYAPEGTDLSRVIRMVLVHDLVEIYAGDTFAFDDVGHRDKELRERQAADQLFGLLPADQKGILRQLWDEYEAQETQEARFARTLDRLQPLIHNYYTDGGTWKKFGVKADRVWPRVDAVAQGSKALGQLAQELVERAIAQGILQS